ncbi:MAG: ABC transporter permease [Promethearchaeota archaeon]
MKCSKWFVWKKGYRTISKNKGKTIPLIMILIFTISFSSVMFDMQDARSKFVNEMVEMTDFADGIVNLSPSRDYIIKNSINKLLNKYVEEYQVRMVLEFEFLIKGVEYQGIVVGIDSHSNAHINVLLDENKNEIQGQEFCMNAEFAKDSNVSIGEEITIRFGNKEKQVIIKNIGYNPEFRYVPLHETMAFPQFTPYPVLYVSLDYINKYFLKEKVPLVNLVLYKSEKNKSREEVKNVVKEVLGDRVKSIIFQEDHPFFKTMREDEESDRQFLGLLSIIFIGGSLLILIIVIHRLVEYDLKFISIFQSLGANKKEIILSYLISTSLINGISIGLGSIIGNLINIPLSNTLASLLGYPFPFQTEFNLNFILLIFTILYLISFLLTLVIVNKSFKMEVQQVLKQEMKFLEKGNVVEKILFKMRISLPPFKKYVIRRIFGKKFQTLFILFTLMLSTTFILFSFGLPDSIERSLHRKIEEIERWDGVAKTWNYEHANVLRKKLDTCSEVKYFEFGIVDTILFSKEKTRSSTGSLLLNAHEENAKLFQIPSENNLTLSYENGVFVSKDVLFTFDLKIGDMIYLKKYTSKGTEEGYAVKIIDIVNDLTELTIYITLKLAQKVLELSNQVNTIYFLIKHDSERAANQVQNLAPVQNVQMKDQLQEELNNSLELFSLFTIIFSMIFMIFGLLIMTIIIKNIVEYRLEDYANFKAIGTQDSEIVKSFILECIFYYMISVPLGFLIGILMNYHLMQYYSIQNPGLVFHIKLESYWNVGLILVIMLLILLLLQFRKIRKINIIKITKERMFG